MLDLERYREADTKIGKVTQPVGSTTTGWAAAYWGRLRGTPPAPDRNIVRLTPWSELTFTGAPRQPARLVFAFTGRFACTEVDDGCEVTHGYEMTFRRPFRWIYEPLLRTWLQSELEDELDRVKQILGGTP